MVGRKQENHRNWYARTWSASAVLLGQLLILLSDFTAAHNKPVCTDGEQYIGTQTCS